MTLDMSPGPGRSGAVSGGSGRACTCPNWCTTDHGDQAGLEARLLVREHTGPVVLIESSTGDRAKVSLVALDCLDAGDRGPTSVYVEGGDALDPASALRLAAALMDAVDVIEATEGRLS